MGNKLRSFWPYFIIILAAFAVYVNSLASPFIWDDYEQIVNNQLVHSLGNIGAFFTGGTFYGGGTGALIGDFYRPVMTTVFAALYVLFGPRAFLFHLFQLMLHILVGCLFYRFLVRLQVELGDKGNKGDEGKVLEGLSKRERKKLRKLQGSKVGQTGVNWFILLLVFLFVVHPINQETVVYAADLQELLFVLFGLAALWVAWFWQARFWSFLAISGLLLLALLTKETSIIFCALLVLFSLFWKIKKLYPFLLSAFLSLIIYGLLRFWVAKIPLLAPDIVPIAQLPLLKRLISIPAIGWYYIKTLLFPKDLVAGQLWVVDHIGLMNFWLPLLYCALFFGILTLGLYFVWRKNRTALPYAFFFFVWFVLGFGLLLNIVPLSATVDDRWFYFAFLGLVGFVATVGRTLGSRVIGVVGNWGVRRMLWVIGLMGVIGMMLGGRTIVRNVDWQDPIRLYSHDLAKNSESFILHTNLGFEFSQANRYEEAVPHFEKAAALRPGNFDVQNNLGVAYEHQGDVEKAKEHFKKSLEISPGDYQPYENLVFLQLINDPESEETGKIIEDGLVRFPENARVWMAKAIFAFNKGDKVLAKQAILTSVSLKQTQSNQYVARQIEAGQPIDMSMLKAE